MVKAAEQDENQNENASPIYMRDQWIKVVQVEPNAPLASVSPVIDDGCVEELIDVQTETDAMRRVSEERLLAKKQQLKKFHGQICQRIAEREQQHRVEAQQREKLLGDKFTKVIEATKPKEKQRSASPRRAARVQALAQHKKELLKESAMSVQIAKVLRLDAQTREVMLASMGPRVGEQTLPAESDWTSNQLESEDDEERKPRNAAHDLLPKQRVALYATVRRRYMDREREDVHRNNSNIRSTPSSGSVSAPKVRKNGLDTNRSSQTSPASLGGTKSADSKRGSNKIPEPRRQSNLGVKIIDMTSGCEVRLHKHVAMSSTPWRLTWTLPPAIRKKGSLSSSAQKAGNQEHERFLNALQNELGTPALCSCARNNMASSPYHERLCANNCALYKHPKKREKLLTSVFKQQQQRAGIRKSFSPPRS